MRKFTGYFNFFFLYFPSWIIFLFLFKPVLAVTANQKSDVSRYAFIVGANDGGVGRQQLRYAISDANMVLEVLNSMGGVSKENSQIVFNPDRANFLSFLKQYRMKISEAKKKSRRVESIFYYSGHSDEEGILLGNEKVFYSEIRKEMETLPADVRIAILDSCSSGAFTTAKGGKIRSPFLNDASFNMKGYAFMTSSSEDEASQESEKLKGSFFTHYLVSGLRGAADMTQDKKITLNEVYQYAYNETLARTEKTLSGPQHPHYYIQMAGAGDVVLTDIRKSSAGLILGKAIAGRIFIRDNNGILAGEFKKPFGAEIEIGVEPGNYVILNEDNGKISDIKISIKEGDRYILRAENFNLKDKEESVSRGNTTEELKNEENRQVLLSLETARFSWYASGDVRFAKIYNSISVFVGGRGAAIINDTFAIGGAGYGLATKPKDFNGYEYNGGYGAALMEYYFFPKKLFSFSIGTLIGAGGITRSIPVDYTNAGSYQYNPGDHSPFFIVEPEINAYINILNNFRIGIGASYRYTSDFNLVLFNQNDFRGFSVGLFLAYGKF